MENTKISTRLVGFLFVLTLGTNLLCRIGCMDNSYHTKQKNDYKTYHYVQCNCECQKYRDSFVRGKCPKCGHFHDPAEFIVLTHADIQKKVAHKQKPASKQKTPKQNVAAKKIINTQKVE